MSYGFSTFDSNGIQSLTSNDLAIQFIDLFSVTPTSSGSKNYNNTVGFTKVIAIATPDEPAVTDASSFFAVNFINVSANISGSTITVSWSPSFQSGNVYNVNIYVFGY